MAFRPHNMRSNHVFHALALMLVFALPTIHGFAADLAECRQLIEKNQVKEAKACLEKLAASPDASAEVNDLFGTVLLRLGDVDGAIDQGELATEKNPASAPFHYNLSKSYLKKVQSSGVMGQAMTAPRAREELEKVVELDPSNTAARADLAVFYLNMPAMMGGGIEKAKTQIEAVIKGDELKGRILLAQLYAKDGKPARAIEEYEAVIAGIGAKSSDAYANFGFLLMKEKKFDRCIEVHKKLVELTSDQRRVAALNSLGNAYKAAGRYEEAATQYEQVLKLNPKHKAAADSLQEIKRKAARS